MNISWIGGLLAAADAKPPLEVPPDTLLFSLVIFLVMLAVLYKYAWGPISEGLELRERKMAEDIEGAKAAHEQAQAQLKAYEAKIAGAQDEAAALIAEAKNDAVAAKERIMADAAEEAQRTRERALAEIEAAKCRQEVALLDEIEQVWANAMIELRGRLRIIPSRVAPLLIGKIDESQIKEIILNEIDQSLTLLSEHSAG